MSTLLNQSDQVLLLCFQRFPLGGDDEVMSSTLQQFAKVIDEVSWPPGNFIHEERLRDCSYWSDWETVV